MQDLTEIGLTNFLTMFLALSCTAEASDAVTPELIYDREQPDSRIFEGGKMTQLLELLSMEKNLKVGKQRRIIWG